MLGLKTVENRTWTIRHRGTLVIHTGRDPALDGRGKVRAITGLDLDPHELPHRAILGTVELVDIITDSTSPWAIAGQFHWLLSNPQPARQPHPWPGRQGLWHFPGRIIDGTIITD